MKSRLLAIVDVFDALTTVRPYRKARPIEEVIKFFKVATGTHFDPYLTGVFLEKVLPRYAAELKNAKQNDGTAPK
jgi:putative two-component system response regulator